MSDTQARVATPSTVQIDPLQVMVSALSIIPSCSPTSLEVVCRCAGSISMSAFKVVPGPGRQRLGPFPSPTLPGPK
jgi:hypothetical protein